MANILNCYAPFLQSWKQQKAKAEAFGSRSLNFRELIDCLNEQNLKKLKEAS